jgi:hypothetical protein
MTLSLAASLLPATSSSCHPAHFVPVAVEQIGERGVWPGSASVVLVVEHGREPLAVPRNCEQRDAVWRERDCGVADCHSDGGV